MSKGKGAPIPQIKVHKDLSAQQAEALLQTLQQRFEQNMSRHRGLKWADVQERLQANAGKLSSLNAMEQSGGEPDVVGFDKKSGEFIFVDCSEQTPEGRRNTCYDGQAQAAREKKGVHPAGNALDLAAEMGIELLDEEQYRQLQKVGSFDTTTSSWLKTPPAIRELGGAIFADRRYDHIFIYHNSAPSFYSSRGFRGALRV